MSTWIILALAVFGVAAALAAFLKTPPEKRYRGVSGPSLQEQLRACPAAAQAVIIKADKARFWLRAIPAMLLCAVFAGFAWWSRNTAHLACEMLLGVSVAYIWLLLLCYAIPVGMLIASMFLLGTAFKTIKTGYFPPLDSVVFRDTLAKKGPLSTFRAMVLLTLPFLALYLVYLGNDLYTQMFEGRSLQEINAMIEKKCR